MGTSDLQTKSYEPEVKKAECAECKGARNCDVKGHLKEWGGDDHFQWMNEWFILRCRGCDHVFALKESSNSEDCNHYYEEDGSTGASYNVIKNYWPAISKRSRPAWMSDAGIDALGVSNIDAAILELYTALDNDLHILAGIGVRTCFDLAAESLGVESEQPFKAKLQQLVDGGHIGIVDLDRLAVLVDAGSASVHRGWKPSVDDLNTMMNILEHFIARAFVEPARQAEMDRRVLEMKHKVPARRRKAK